MKIFLCGDPKSCCPSVEVLNDCIRIGEADNTCTLTMEEWNTLKNKIKNNEI